jgi:prefoldin beta subunit
MAAVAKETQEKINELQVAEQALQSYLQQRQNFQTQEIEIESALKELENTDTAYKIVGNIMVKSSKEELKKDLESKKEMVSIRLKNIEKQEKNIKDKAQKIQAEILQNINKGG